MRLFNLTLPKLILILVTSSLFSTSSLVGDEVLTIGSKAPSIDVEHWLSNGNGKFPVVKKFQTGKVYVVEFWATWCGPCVASMPHISKLQNKFSDQGVQIISVSEEDLETVEEFLKKNVTHADYRRCLLSNNRADQQQRAAFQTIRSTKHQIKSLEINKVGLCSFDNKRYLVDAVNSLSYGHYKIAELKS